MVGQPVEEAHHRRVHRLRRRQRHHLPLRPPHQRARHMRLRRRRRAARQDEAGQRRHRRVHRRDLRLQPRRPARRSGAAARRASPGTHRSAPTSNRSFWMRASIASASASVARQHAQHADRGVGLIDAADRLDARCVLGHARAVAERGLARHRRRASPPGRSAPSLRLPTAPARRGASPCLPARHGW